MSLLVIDASVAAKWSLQDENLVVEAAALLDRYGRSEVRVTVPDLFWGEIANILWKALLKRRCTREDIESSMTALKRLYLPTVPSTALIERAVQIAVDFNRSVYDSIYVALAVEAHAVLITADEKLANAVAAYLPVKWLGAT